MAENILRNLEKELGVKHSNITREQIQAAYALNLCAVSVSQIIDYNDINILEQEYEAILNNLNLENMPKDEALLDIIKRLLETITFFRIQEQEKEFVEKEYQQKMKNAIWNAMPNPGALISTGLSLGTSASSGANGAASVLKNLTQNPIGLAVSLAATVGTAYMSYRKNKAEYQSEKEKKQWELKKTAIEQFQTLQQQLFETSWRLADKYEFPDILRLSERQIKQYNAILMDADEVRKFERLDSIKHKFAAYPPFWYFLGNTASGISLSEHYGLDTQEKAYYREYAKTCFEYFTIVNKYNLLREDQITASCYLEYVDLLDPVEDRSKIEGLLKKAVGTAGNSLDILQLCALGYIKIGAMNDAAFLLRQLVNEQYNEVTNAQLLSTIYVNSYIEMQSVESKSAYGLLESRIDPQYLFPWPADVANSNMDKLNKDFINLQKDILKTKYKLVFERFIKKYEARINAIIPIPEDIEQVVSEEAYSNESRVTRIEQVKLALHDGARGEEYKLCAQNICYSYEMLRILNEMFGSVCLLECIQDEHKQFEMQQIIENGINKQKNQLIHLEEGLKDFNEETYKDMQEMTLKSLTDVFFEEMAKQIVESVKIKKELRDFAIAELNLCEFCKKEGIEEPESLYAHKDDAKDNETQGVYFSPDLIGDEVVIQNERIQKNQKMIDAIKRSIAGIVRNKAGIEFYTLEDSRMNRYFYGKKFSHFRRKTLAVLDDRTKGDMDLLFTTEGVMPIIRGKGKTIAPYDEIKWTKSSSKKELFIGIKYSNDNLDMDSLYDLIRQLDKFEEKIDSGTI